MIMMAISVPTLVTVWMMATGTVWKAEQSPGPNSLGNVRYFRVSEGGGCWDIPVCLNGPAPKERNENVDKEADYGDNDYGFNGDSDCPANVGYELEEDSQESTLDHIGPDEVAKFDEERELSYISNLRRALKQRQYTLRDLGTRCAGSSKYGTSGNSVWFLYLMMFAMAQIVAKKLVQRATAATHRAMFVTTKDIRMVGVILGLSYRRNTVLAMIIPIPTAMKAQSNTILPSGLIGILTEFVDYPRFPVDLISPLSSPSNASPIC